MQKFPSVRVRERITGRETHKSYEYVSNCENKGACCATPITVRQHMLTAGTLSLAKSRTHPHAARVVRRGALRTR